MKRRVYVVCQKRNWNKGSPQVVSDGAGHILDIYAGEDGLRRAKSKVETMNMIKKLQPVHLRKATLVFEEKIKHDAILGENEVRG